jgi:hypothetical protein
MSANQETNAARLYSQTTVGVQSEKESYQGMPLGMPYQRTFRLCLTALSGIAEAVP